MTRIHYNANALKPSSPAPASTVQAVRMGALTEEEAKAIETVPHYTHDEEQAYCMLYGEGVFDTRPIEACLRTVFVHSPKPLPRGDALFSS